MQGLPPRERGVRWVFRRRRARRLGFHGGARRFQTRGGGVQGGCKGGQRALRAYRKARIEHCRAMHDLLIEREGGTGRCVAKGIMHDAVSAPSSTTAAIGDRQLAAVLGQENGQVSASARVLLLQLGGLIG